MVQWMWVSGYTHTSTTLTECTALIPRKFLNAPFGSAPPPQEITALILVHRLSSPIPSLYVHGIVQYVLFWVRLLPL